MHIKEHEMKFGFHGVVTWIHFGTDTLVTPALTFEYADFECYGRYSIYGEGFPIYDGNHDGQVR